MAKAAIYFEEAQRLYVQEGLSLDAIVEVLGGKVSRRTLYNWKIQGDWDEKRRNYLKQTEDIQSQLTKLAQIAMKEALANPTPHNIYAVMKAISALKMWQGVKVIEEEAEKTEKSTEALREIIKTIASEEIK